MSHLYVGWMTPNKKEFNDKAKNGGMNREARRKFLKDLQPRATLSEDMVNDYRAKRRRKRLAANKTRSKNRRLGK